MDPDQSVDPTLPVRPAEPSGEDLLPQPLVNRYAVPMTTLLSGAVVAEADQVVIKPVPESWAPGGTGPVSGDDGD